MQAIRKETLRVQEEWEASLTAVAKSNKAASADDRFVTSQCFRLKQETADKGTLCHGDYLCDMKFQRCRCLLL